MSWLWLIIFCLIFGWLVALTILLAKILKHKTLVSRQGDTRLMSWSLIKFNPFQEMGGQHSFVVTLLDGSRSGFIMTGLHGRGLTRFYIKQVTNGRADQPLSEEEQRGLAQAKHE